MTVQSRKQFGVGHRIRLSQAVCNETTELSYGCAQMGAALDHVRSYYESLNTADAGAVAAHFADDAVHYYTRREPHVGAQAIADNAVLAVTHLGARWTLEHAVEGDEEVAIEWSMAFDHPRSGRRCLDRGAEFLTFRDGLICEVRAYYHGGVPGNPSGDLVGFDHARRGHAVLDAAAEGSAHRC